MDLEINQYIERKDLPKEGIFLDSFPKLKLEERKGTKYYYEKLAEERKKGDKMDAALKAMLEGGAAEAMHKTWKDFEDVSEAEKRLMEKMVEGMMKETANSTKGGEGRGVIPGEIEEILKGFDIPEEAVFDWKSYFRKFACFNFSTEIKTTRMRPNKRFPGNPALKFKKKNHVLIVRDSSGSVSDAEFEEFNGEIHHVWKSGTAITVIDCDTKMYEPIEYTGQPDQLLIRRGNGGTTFDMPIIHFNEHPEYTCLVYFTDGGAPAPKDQPRNGGRLLWIISSRGSDNWIKDYPGIKIQIPEQNGK